MKTSLFVFMSGKRYKPKYTKAYKNRLKEAQRAVRNYNRAVTLIEKSMDRVMHLLDDRLMN